MQILVQAQHNVEYETSFDEDDTKWDMEEAINKFNDDNFDLNKLNSFLSSYFAELNLDLITIKVIEVNDCYLTEGQQSKVYRYMQDEPIFKIEFKLQVNGDNINEDELVFVANSLIDTIFENLETNTVYVNETGTAVEPGFDFNGYYEISKNFEDDEGEVTFYLDHRDDVEIKMIKEVE